MARVLEVPAIPGGEALLALLSNKKAATAHLKSMIDMRAEINEMISAWGTIGEIESLRLKTRSEKEQAKTILADAETKAVLIIADAEEKNAEATTRLGGLDHAAREIERSAQSRSKEIARREDDVLALETAVTAREEAVSTTEEAVKSALEAAGESKMKLDRTLASIADVAQQGA